MRDQRLTAYARENRKNMPEPEIRMWLELRAGRFKGVKFRRQKVIGPYIADFAANDPKLVVEIDGDTHHVGDERDRMRTAFLESQGYRVQRYANNEVMRNLEGVLMHLASVIDEMQAPTPNPLP